MAKYFPVFFWLLFFFQAHSQTLPAHRATDWSLAGHEGSFYEPQNQVDFLAAGGVPDGITPNDSLFSGVLSAAGDDSLVIYFPNGNYFFADPIELGNHTILRGESGDSTILTFDLDAEVSCISVQGERSNDSTLLAADAAKDDYSIEVVNSASFAPGDYIYLIDNDSDLVLSTWALGSTGQIIRIDSIAGNQLHLGSPLRRDYALSKNALLHRLDLMHDSGVEMLRVVRLDTTVGHHHNIYFRYTRNCWVKCVESYNCNYGHITFRFCTKGHVSGSYMQDAMDYGGGGNGYGIVMQYGTGECLITQNNFKHLRHSMILSVGVNGNVLSYNYSTDPFWVDPVLPANSAGDLVLHGDYPYLNLFEGNTVQHIVIDDSHGENGPYNTFFRNRAELYGFFMNWGTPTNDQNIMGNEITNTGFLMGNYTISGTGHFQHGNNHRGSITPSGTDHLPESTLYLDSVPSYYTTHSNWPPIGPPNSLDAYTIENEEAFLAGHRSSCTYTPPPLSGVVEAGSPKLLLHPNPAGERVAIEVPGIPSEQLSRLSIIALNGKIVRTGSFVPNVSLHGLSPGLYLLILELQDGSRLWERLVIQ